MSDKKGLLDSFFEDLGDLTKKYAKQAIEEAKTKDTKAAKLLKDLGL